MPMISIIDNILFSKAVIVNIQYSKLFVQFPHYIFKLNLILQKYNKNLVLR